MLKIEPTKTCDILPHLMYLISFVGKTLDVIPWEPQPHTNTRKSCRFMQRADNLPNNSQGHTPSNRNHRQFLNTELQQLLKYVSVWNCFCYKKKSI